jgi:hypothetical protein
VDHVVDRSSFQWAPARGTPAVAWPLWALCALFCVSASTNTGVTGVTFGLPFAFILVSLAFKGYARTSTFTVLFVCAVLKFAQDPTSSLYFNGVGDMLELKGSAEFCPNAGGGRPYLADRCEAPASPRFKRTLGKVQAGLYSIQSVDAEYDELSTRYVYVVDTEYGPARVSPSKVQVTWHDGQAVDDSTILKDVPRWLSMLMFYPKVPLLLFQDGAASERPLKSQG